MARRDLRHEREALAGTALREGAVGGLLAGALLLLLEMIVATAAGESLGHPWAMAASIVMGQGALELPFSVPIFIAGFVVHFVLSALFGVIWGAVSKSVAPSIRDSFGPHGLAATLYGALLWLLNFQVIARLFYPWFLQEGAPWAQLPLHALGFGLPLGLYLAARLRPLDRLPRAVRA